MGMPINHNRIQPIAPFWFFRISMAPPFLWPANGQLICQEILLDNPLKLLKMNIKTSQKEDCHLPSGTIARA
jgi:hypothetical protein